MEKNWALPFITTLFQPLSCTILIIPRVWCLIPSLLFPAWALMAVSFRLTGQNFTAASGIAGTWSTSGIFALDPMRRLSLLYIQLPLGAPIRARFRQDPTGKY